MAEVLITLSIIGIVAAMTIPSLITAHNKRVTVVSLKKAYSTLVQAVRLAENEHGVGFDMTDVLDNTNYSPRNSEKVFEKYLAPHLKINFKYTDANCRKLTEAHVQSNKNELYTDSNGACYNLLNGTSIIFWASKQRSMNGSMPVYVIINPNKKYKILGRDVFAFAIANRDNGLEVGTNVRFIYNGLEREELIRYCNANTARVTLNGYSGSLASFCTELIMRDGWVISTSYPIKL